MAKKAAGRSTVGLKVSMKRSRNAMTALRGTLKAGRKKAANPELVDELLDAIKTFLELGTCQGSSMTRRF